MLAAGFLIVFGIQYVFFPTPDGTQFALDASQGALLTGFIVVATVNAVNFVDGLDGLAAGVVGIGAVAFFLFCYQLTRFNDTSRATTSALLSVALAGACAGFLAHNFHPARIFMGDSGSMLIGLVLSASAVTLTGQFAGNEISQGAAGSRASLVPTLLPLALPISIMVVPLLDLVLAVVRRTRAGRSPFAPDKQHLHHRLLEIGHSQRRAVLIMWMWAGLVAFGTVLVSLYTGPWMWGGLAALAALTITVTFLLPRVHRLPDPASGGVGSDRPSRGGAAQHLRRSTQTPPVTDRCGLCASFHKHRPPLTDRPPNMTTACRSSLLRTTGGAPRTAPVPGFARHSCCGSFTPSSDVPEKSLKGCLRAGVVKPADESDLGGWSMRTPKTRCAVATSQGSGVSSPAPSSRARSSGCSWTTPPARPRHSPSWASRSASSPVRSASGCGSGRHFGADPR